MTGKVEQSPAGTTDHLPRQGFKRTQPHICRECQSNEGALRVLSFSARPVRPAIGFECKA